MSEKNYPKQYDEYYDDFIRELPHSKNLKDWITRVGLKPTHRVYNYARSLNVDKSHFTHGHGGHSSYEKFVGQTKNYWTVLSVQEKIDKDRKYPVLQCKCVCGTIRLVRPNYWKNGKSKSCGCQNPKKLGSEHHAWSGFNDISGSLFTHFKHNALCRDLTFDVSIEYLWDLFLTQDKKCALSGERLVLSPSNDRSVQTASLDRIDSSKGYTESNVQWVHKKINIMKQDMSDKEFVHFCTKVSNYHADNK